MPGNQLNNYDLVVEFSEQAYNDVLGVFFDTGGFICNLFSDLTNFLHIPPLPCPIPKVSVSFDVPTDISLPPGTTDIVDVTVALSSADTLSSIGTLRFVARVNVNHTTISGGQNVDLVQIDLSPSGLLYTNIDITTPLGPINNTNDALTKALNSIGFIPVAPVPVKPGSNSPMDIVSAGVRVIDDHSTQDLDASALMITFGGGIQGNPNGFVQSFVPTGTTGAVGLSFDWMCRFIRPHLASALNVPVSDFDAPCRLNTSINLQGDHNPKLTGLELTLVDGAIHISAAVSASDTGWSASATVGGSILISVENGNLIVKTNIDDPNIDVSLDWWVYLAAAVVGAIIGGIIAGVIGAIVGAILVPLIAWLASNLLSGIINNIANQIVNTLKNFNLNVDVSAIGFNIFFQNVTIDDVVIGSQVKVTENAPIKSEGTIVVKNGQWFDLDSGSVGDHNLSSADLAWDGTNINSRVLHNLCSSKIARTYGTNFDIPRYRLYGLYYESPASIPESELCIGNSFPLLPGFPSIPTMRVYAVWTSEERFSLVQVIGVSQSEIVVRYKTFEKELPRVRIIGGFNASTVAQFKPGHGIVGADLKEENAQFEPLQVVEATPVGSSTTQEISKPSRGKVASILESKNLNVISPGTWKIPVPSSAPNSGVFKAVLEDFPGKKYHWYVNKKKLTTSHGELMLQHPNFPTLKYEITSGGKVITFTRSSVSMQGFHFELGVKVTTTEHEAEVTQTESSVFDSRCVEVPGEVKVFTEATVSWPLYQSAFTAAFGSMEVQVT